MASPLDYLSDAIKQNATVMPVLEHVVRRSTEHAELDMRLREIHKAIPDEAIRMADEMSAEDAQTLAMALYWLDDKHVPIDAIAIIYGNGVRPRDVHKHMGHATIYTPCACGEMVYLTVHSRNEKKEVLNNIKKARANGQFAYKCADCQARADEELARRREADKRRAEALVRTMNEDVQALRDMPYGEYLQTEHWAGTRKAALRRARYACQLCGAKGRLNVHHKTYARRGCEEPNDLIVLCQDCHAKFHDKVEEPA